MTCKRKLELIKIIADNTGTYDVGDEFELIEQIITADNPDEHLKHLEATGFWATRADVFGLLINAT